VSAAPYDRVRLTALRYAVTDESEQYIAVMRVFTAGTAGLLSDLSAREVADSLHDQHGLELDVDVVDARLSYLVNHGNLARSPRETEARSIREYLTTRARYQLTQRGELVHRQVEELLAATDEVREVSTEMLGGILAGLRVLQAYDAAALSDADPDAVAGQVATVFAQFERLVTSTRAFYASLSQVLSRYDLGREDCQAFKAALIDYLQRFVDQIARTMPQIGELLRDIDPAPLLVRANTGTRLVGLDGAQAARAAPLELLGAVDLSGAEDVRRSGLLTRLHDAEVVARGVGHQPDPGRFGLLLRDRFKISLLLLVHLGRLGVVDSHRRTSQRSRISPSCGSEELC